LGGAFFCNAKHPFYKLNRFDLDLYGQAQVRDRWTVAAARHMIENVRARSSIGYNGMEPDFVAKLSEGQRACLRRVFMHMSSKDIARELEISPHTVDQRLRVAMQTLGVANRFEAARMLAQYERPELYQPPLYQAPYVAPISPTPTVSPTGHHGDRQYGQAYGGTLREEQVAFRTTAWPAPQSFRLPLPPAGGGRNDLGYLPRLGWIAAIAVGTALSFGMLLTGLDALSRLL
jgi:DNA-binding CsgD family transcriptional regulator